MIQTALRNPYLIVVVALALVVLGGYSYTKIPADLLPQFETSAVQIVTFYPGMPPEVMEKDIMSRLQRWTGQSVGIEHQEATAMQSVCIVKDFFREGISMDTAMSQVTSYAMSDMFYLPPGTIPPMVMPFDPTASVPLCLVVVDNPLMNEKELYDIAYYQLRNKLQSIQGVIAPAVYGGKLRRILAYVDREKLEAHNLSLTDVQQALMKQNTLIPAGSIKVDQQELQIYTNANVEKVEQLNDVPIKVVDGVPVLMRDIGEVRDSSQIQTNIVRVNGSKKAYIPIYRQPRANTISIVQQIKKQLQTIEERLRVEVDDPRMKSLVLSVAMDQSIGVQQGINSLQVAAVLGAVLAGIVVFVFLQSIRYTFIVLLSIPLAIGAAFFGLFFTGDTVNAMTLGGLALAIGILVDQSIVVLENIVRHAQMGKRAFDAALDGAREVAVPMLVATITFTIVFFPVVFLSGLARFLFTPLAIAACIAIVSSYIMAITLVPAYCANYLSVEGDPTHEASSSGLAAWYQSFLTTVLSVRHLVVIGALVAFGLAVFAMTNLMGRELFPQSDAGQMIIYVRMPTGTRIESTEKVLDAKTDIDGFDGVEQIIQNVMGKPDFGYAAGREQHKDSDLQLLVSNIGVLLDWPAAYTPNTGSMDAFLLVQTKGHRSIFDYVDILRKELNENFPAEEGYEFAFNTGGMLSAALNMGETSPIHFQISGSQLDTSYKVAEQIVEVAKNVRGTADARIAQRIDYPILEVEMNRELASRLGQTPEDVMKNLVSATNSSINFQPAFWLNEANGNHYFFGVQYWERDLNSIDTLLNIPIGSDENGPRRLGSVATIRRSKRPAVINHRNITRVVDVYVNVQRGYDVGSVVSRIEAGLVNIGAKPDIDERGELYQLGYYTNKEVEENNATVEKIAKLPLSDGREKLANGDSNPNNYKGVRFRMLGEVRSMRESFSQFTGGLVIAAILVYLVMVAQFRSFVDPLIVLLTVPLGFIGVVAMLLLTGTNLSIMAFMGIVMMVGIVVEYSIVLVDFANQRVHDGLSPREAIIDAAGVRLRPILMTSLTTWLAMLPMAFPGLLSIFGMSGGEANAPLARAIIGGVLGATALSLIVVPCLYVMLKRPEERPQDRDSGASVASV